MPWARQYADSLCLGAQDAARFSPGTNSYHQGRCEFAGGKLEDAEGDYAARNYATSVCWGDERRLEASRQWANARVQAAMDMQAGCRLHSSRVQNFRSYRSWRLQVCSCRNALTAMRRKPSSTITSWGNLVMLSICVVLSAALLKLEWLKACRMWHALSRSELSPS